MYRAYVCHAAVCTTCSPPIVYGGSRVCHADAPFHVAVLLKEPWWVARAGVGIEQLSSHASR